MSSSSMEDDDPSVFSSLDNKDYNEACDVEVNDMVPRLERLRLDDDELLNLPDDNMNIPDFSIDTVSSSINLEGASMPDSRGEIPPSVGDVSGRIQVNEANNLAIDRSISLSSTEGTSEIPSTTPQNHSLSQDAIQRALAGCEIDVHPLDPKDEKTLNKSNKTKEIGLKSSCTDKPLNLSTICNMGGNEDTESSSEVPMGTNEHPNLIADATETMHADPETGETSENSNNILSDGIGCNSMENVLNQYADAMSNDIIFGVDSTNQPCLSDISSDNQSCTNSDIAINSRPDIPAMNVAPVEDKYARKKVDVLPSVSERSEIRKRRFCAVQPPLSIIDATKINFSSDDDDSKDSGVIKKDSPIISGRKCKKSTKLSPRQITLRQADVNKKEKRPSPLKRKKTSSETMTETTGKLRKRTISEHTSETRGEKVGLAARSRSLSSGLKNIASTSATNPQNEIPRIQLSRKRANSDSYNASRIKSRRSSSSSDEAENK